MRRRLVAVVAASFLASCTCSAPFAGLGGLGCGFSCLFSMAYPDECGPYPRCDPWNPTGLLVCGDQYPIEYGSCCSCTACHPRWEACPLAHECLESNGTASCVHQQASDPDCPWQVEETWNDPHLPNLCGAVSTVGCCDGSYFLQYCRDNEVWGAHCGKVAKDASCGWNPNRQIYECGYIGTDPSGQHPYRCPGAACVSSCQDRECGSDGCGGSCGTCSEGSICEWQPGTYKSRCVAAPGCDATPLAGCCDGSFLFRCDGLVSQETACFRYEAPGDQCGWLAAEGRYGCGADGEDPSGAAPRHCPWVVSAGAPDR